MNRLKHRVKTALKTLRRKHAETFRSFTPEDLRRALRDLGVGAAPALMVHSSFDAFTGFTGKPSDILAALRDVLGPDALLMLPTLPFDGAAVAYARENPVTDLKRAPSRMGLLTELFRRSPGVVRSTHPTHPIAISGADAAAIGARHAQAATPCGRASPFEELANRKGAILFLGTDLSTMTFFHYAEEVFEDRLPASPFTTEVFDLACREPGGALVPVRTRLFDPALSRRRNILKLTPHFEAAGAVRRGRVGTVTLTLLQAAPVLAVIGELAGRGVYGYD